MNRDDIIRMAREAGFEIEEQVFGKFTFICVDGVSITETIKKFADLAYAKGFAAGAAAEREACAKACDRLGDEYADANAAHCALAIRARGQE